MSVAEVCEVFAQVMSDFRIPYTRVPVEPGLHSCLWLPLHLRRFYTQVEKNALDAIPVFMRYNIRCVCVLLSDFKNVISCKQFQLHLDNIFVLDIFKQLVHLFLS